MQNVASTAQEDAVRADDQEGEYVVVRGGAVAAGMLLLRVSLDIAGSSLGDVHSERSSGGDGGDNDEPVNAV